MARKEYEGPLDGFLRGRTRLLVFFCAVPMLLGWATQVSGQSKSSQGTPDVQWEIYRQLREAYKAPYEVHEDVLKEIRRSYQQPAGTREGFVRVLQDDQSPPG